MTIRYSSPWLLAALVGCALPVDLAGQVTGPGTDATIRPLLGFAVGMGSIPGSLSPTCAHDFGATPAFSADFRVGVRRGSLRLESRTSAYADATLEDCLFLNPHGSNGIDTIRATPFERGGYSVTDIRLAYVRRDAGIRWLISGGVGWAWQRDAPVVLVGSGIRVGRTISLALDADLLAYRVPWDVVVAEWSDFQVIREIDRRREHDWRSGFSIRLGLELSPGAFP